MQITEVQATFSKKVQEEQYEPFTVSETVTVQVEDGDDVNEVEDAAHDIVESAVRRRIDARLGVEEVAEDDGETIQEMTGEA